MQATAGETWFMGDSVTLNEPRWADSSGGLVCDGDGRCGFRAANLSTTTTTLAPDSIYQLGDSLVSGSVVCDGAPIDPETKCWMELPTGGTTTTTTLSPVSPSEIIGWSVGGSNGYETFDSDAGQTAIQCHDSWPTDAPEQAVATTLADGKPASQCDGMDSVTWIPCAALPTVFITVAVLAFFGTALAALRRELREKPGLMVVNGFTAAAISPIIVLLWKFILGGAILIGGHLALQRLARQFQVRWR